MTDPDQNTALLEPRQPPKITELIEMLRTAVSMNSDAITRMSTALRHKIKRPNYHERSKQSREERFLSSVLFGMDSGLDSATTWDVQRHRQGR